MVANQAEKNDYVRKQIASEHHIDQKSRRRYENVLARMKDHAKGIPALKTEIDDIGVIFQNENTTAAQIFDEKQLKTKMAALVYDDISCYNDNGQKKPAAEVKKSAKTMELQKVWKSLQRM
jgi:hypothetical protein